MTGEPQNPVVELLEAASRDFSWPVTPDLVPGVQVALAATSRRRSPGIVRIAAAVAAVVLAFCGALLVDSGVREAIADFFGVRGYRPESASAPAFEATRSAATPVSFSSAARPVTEQEAAGILHRDLPRIEGPEPLAFYTLESAPRPVVIARYPGFDLWVWDGELAGIVKLTLEGETSLQPVERGPVRGYWVHGGLRLLVVRQSGAETSGVTILADANALIFEGSGGLTLRIEGAGTIEEALAIASLIR